MEKINRFQGDKNCQFFVFKYFIISSLISYIILIAHIIDVTHLYNSECVFFYILSSFSRSIYNSPDLDTYFIRFNVKYIRQTMPTQQVVLSTVQNRHFWSIRNCLMVVTPSINVVVQAQCKIKLIYNLNNIHRINYCTKKQKPK